MNLENATKVVWEGQKTIGLKPQDVEKLSISQVSTSSFSVDNSAVQSETSGGQVPEDHTINTSVIDNGVKLQEEQPQVYAEAPSDDNLVSTMVSEPVLESVSETPSNIFDVPKESFQSEILQPEMVLEPKTSTFGYDEAISQDITQSGDTNIFDSSNSFVQPETESSYIPQEPMITETPVYQESKQQVDTNTMFYQPQPVEPNIPLDTPQTFYEKQVDSEAHGGFSNMPVGESKSEIPNVNTDPVVIMLDEVMRTVNERSSIADSLLNENMLLKNQNVELRNENERLKQQILELNNKVLIAEAQRQAAEQTLAGARMAESGMVNNNGVSRVYQPQQQMPQNNYYQQAA